MDDNEVEKNNKHHLGGPNVWDFTRLDAAICMLTILSTKVFGNTKSNPKHFARDVRS